MNNGYINYLNASKKSENTIKNYTRHINEMLNIIKKDETEITYADLMNWQSEISNCAPATLNLKISAVMSYFKYLYRIGAIKENPAINLEKVRNNPKEKDYVSAEDMKAIIKNMYTAEGKAIVALMASTGLRYIEMANITLEEYKNALATDRSIVIVGKGNKERMVYLNSACLGALQNYLNVL